MRIHVVNPNTSPAMTEVIAAAARSCRAQGTEIVARTSPQGPASSEGHYDEAMAVVGVLDAIRQAEEEGCDAHVIACFGDPGLRAAREIANGPVVGVAEAAMHLASLVATHFSIVTTLARTKVIAEHLALTYGMERICRRVRSIDVAVLDLHDPASQATERLFEECRRAIEEDGSGAVILGCAGMADLAADLTLRLGVPVIESVSAAVKLAESLVALGVSTSKRGDYAAPLSKPFRGSGA